MNNTVLNCENIVKTFTDGDNRTEVLKGINLEVKEGEMVAIVGQSGSGKSTLLHILGGLDDPTSGKSSLNNFNWKEMSSSKKDSWRNKYLGVVYQQHHLLNEFSAIENVAMPLIIRGQSKSVAKETAKEILTKVGLSERLNHSPSALSGGERQRVSIARALVTKPKCLIADEPTGNLDTKAAEGVFDLLYNLAKENKTAVILVTHDEKLASKMDRKVTIKDGLLI